jgi:hypothetical protein
MQMRTQFLLGLCTLACLLPGSVTRADFIVPRALTNVDGDDVSTTSGFFGESLGGTGTTRLYQMSASELAILGLNVGDKIIGVRSRLDVGEAVSLPAANVVVSDLEMTMAQAANTLAGMSINFAANLLNPVMVRDGPYTLLANSLPGGGSPTNAFGGLIPFDVPYAYQGGDLVFMFSRTAVPTPITRLDAGNHYPDENTHYRTLVHRSVYQAVTGEALQEFTPIYQFVVVPEPASLALFGIAAAGAIACLRLRTVS